MLRTVEATRYVTPLREGGSLPAVVEADDLGTYVLKFQGAGQGRKALVAEIVAGEIARSLGLLVPEIVLMDLDPKLAWAEPDPEIQDLIRASAGLNLALDFLPGSLGFDPLVEPPGPDLASRILWFDALVTNVDRTPRNPNLLTWHDRLWLIDHGASLYFHHGWRSGVTDPARFAAQPWDTSGHVFESCADRARELDEEIAAQLGREVFTEVLAAVPDVWLEPVPGPDGADLGPDALREAYVDFLTARLGTRQWLPGPKGEVPR